MRRKQKPTYQQDYEKGYKQGFTTHQTGGMSWWVPPAVFISLVLLVIIGVASYRVINGMDDRNIYFFLGIITACVIEAVVTICWIGVARVLSDARIREELADDRGEIARRMVSPINVTFDQGGLQPLSPQMQIPQQQMYPPLIDFQGQGDVELN